MPIVAGSHVANDQSELPDGLDSWGLAVGGLDLKHCSQRERKNCRLARELRPIAGVIIGLQGH